MHILHTVLHTVHTVLTRRICVTIKSFFNWWSVPLFSRPLCLILGWYCKEKLEACLKVKQQSMSKLLNHLSPFPLPHINVGNKTIGFGRDRPLIRLAKTNQQSSPFEIRIHPDAPIPTQGLWKVHHSRLAGCWSWVFRVCWYGRVYRQKAMFLMLVHPDSMVVPLPNKKEEEERNSGYKWRDEGNTKYSLTPPIYYRS